MPLPAERRVFISYARKDGAALAQRLQKDLNEQGFDAWLDTQRIKAAPSGPPRSSTPSTKPNSSWR